VGQSRSALQGGDVVPALGLPAIVVWTGSGGHHCESRPATLDFLLLSPVLVPGSQPHPPSRLWFTRELSRSEILNLRRARLLTGTSVKVTSAWPVHETHCHLPPVWYCL
jgi:hypothetical protein